MTEEEKKFYENLGKAIKKARIISDLHSSGLAKQLKISPQQMLKYESGKDRISIFRLMKMGKILETDLQRLIEFSTGN